MKPGIDPQHFASMRKSRTRGAGLKGDIDGFRASQKVWTCTYCTTEVQVSPYAHPHTRSRPRKCARCKGASWVYSASQKEADRYIELNKSKRVSCLKHPPEPLTLKSLVKGGGITNVRTYRADFSYRLTENLYDIEGKMTDKQWSQTVYEDHKPHNRLTDLAKLVHLLVWHQHNIDVLITWYTGRGKSRRINQAWSSELR